MEAGVVLPMFQASRKAKMVPIANMYVYCWSTMVKKFEKAPGRGLERTREGIRVRREEGVGADGACPLEEGPSGQVTRT